MVALLTAAVRIGTILRFEMALLCRSAPRRRSVLGLGLAVAAVLFYLDVIFVGIYLYGRIGLPP